MAKNNSDKDGYIPVDEDKLKEDLKAEVQQATERFRRECLKSFSATRSGEVIKKFDFPALQPLTEAQHENKMLDAVHQAVNHAFINHAPVTMHTGHNAVVKTLGEGAFKGYKGPCYMQPNQMGLTMDPSASGTGQRRSESVSEPF
jgi:flagellar capping protein FliD